MKQNEEGRNLVKKIKNVDQQQQKLMEPSTLLKSHKQTAKKELQSASVIVDNRMEKESSSLPQSFDTSDGCPECLSRTNKQEGNSDMVEISVSSSTETVLNCSLFYDKSTAIASNSNFTEDTSVSKSVAVIAPNDKTTADPSTSQVIERISVAKSTDSIVSEPDATAATSNCKAVSLVSNSNSAEALSISRPPSIDLASCKTSVESPVPTNQIKKKRKRNRKRKPRNRSPSSKSPTIQNIVRVVEDISQSNTVNQVGTESFTPHISEDEQSVHDEDEHSTCDRSEEKEEWSTVKKKTPSKTNVVTPVQ